VKSEMMYSVMSHFTLPGRWVRETILENGRKMESGTYARPVCDPIRAHPRYFEHSNPSHINLWSKADCVRRRKCHVV